MALCVGTEYANGRRSRQRAKTLLAFAEGILGLPAPSDVADYAAEKHPRAGFPGGQGQFDGNFAPVLAQGVQLDDLPDDFGYAGRAETPQALKVRIAVTFG